MVKKYAVFVMFWMFWGAKLFTQSLFFHHLTSADGLPSNIVYDVFQDSLGYMWLATEGGVVKYNGVGYEKFNAPKLKTLAVTNLLEIDNQLFGKNFSGDIISVFKDRLEVMDFWIQKGHKGFPSLGKAEKKLIVYNSNIGYLWDPATKKEEVLYDAGAQHHSLIQIEYKDKDYRLLCIDEKGRIAIVEKRKGDKTTYTHYLQHYKHEKGLLKLLKRANNLYLFNYTKATLYRINKDYSLTLTIAAQSNETKIKYTDFVFINDSVSARCGYNGVDLYLNDKPFRQILKGKAVSRIVQDRDGNYWVATLRDGVFIFPSLYNFNYSFSEDAYVTKLIQSPNGEIIMGTYTGNILAFENGQITRRIKTDRTTEIQAMTFDEHEKELLVFADKLMVLSWPTGNVVREYAVTSTKKIIAKNKKYYLVTSDGIYILDKKSQRIEKQYLKGQRCKSAIWSDQDTGLYIAALDGLYLLKDNNLIKSEKINAGIDNLYLDEGYLWVYTLARELRAYQKGQLIYTKSLQKSMNGNESVVFKDKKIWISEKNCIKYALLKIPVLSFNKLDEEVMNSELLDIFPTSKGLYMCFSQGIQYITSNRAKKKPNTIIVLSKILLAEKRLSAESGKLELAHNFRSLKLCIDILPERFVFGLDSVFYRLKNFHSSWIYLDNAENQIEFSSLPHGNYELLVKVVKWNGTLVVRKLIDLKIKPAFWNQWWFWPALLLLLLVTLYFFVKARIRNIKWKAQEAFERKYREKELQIAGLTALRAQMNPHFIFNSLSTIQSKVILNDMQAATTQLNKFARLMRQILELSGEEEITVKRELQMLKDYLEIEQIRMNGDLIYQISAEDELENLYIPSLITQPFVENALIHGLRHKQGAKQLDVGFNTENRLLKITITDNGIGRSESARINLNRTKHKSFAMSAYQRRIELLNQLQNSQISITVEDLKDKDQRALGTRVVIYLPLKTKKNESSNA